MSFLVSIASVLLLTHRPDAGKRRFGTAARDMGRHAGTLVALAQETMFQS
jgi:hypothetical protein